MEKQTMRTGIIATSIALGLAVSACAQSTGPQRTEAPQSPDAPPLEPVAPPPPASAGGGARGGPPGDYGAALAQQRAAVAQQREEQARQQQEAMANLKGQVFSNDLFQARVAWGPADRAVVITTEPFSAEAEAELTEDLGVMDKLLSDETSRAGGGSAAPRAMGIKLSALAMAEPTYIEGLGAVFEYRVGLPLAAGPGGANSSTKPAPPSAWETAKRELTARRGPAGPYAATIKPAVTELPTFDPAKLDQLTNAIIKTLIEAKNMRHLKEGDVVIVTISGTDDAAKPVRMTLKAKKSDIDQAASGAISAEEFQQRVARRVG